MDPVRRALAQRFRESLKDDRQLLHHLPNGLFVVTLVPEYAATIGDISDLPVIDQKLAQGEQYCVIDGKPLCLPFAGVVVDVNPDPNGSIAKFAVGPTTSFLLIVKPTHKPDFQFPESFVPY
jgi:glycine cleavage system H lipoate-binding protein